PRAKVQEIALARAVRRNPNEVGAARAGRVVNDDSRPTSPRDAKAVRVERDHRTVRRPPPRILIPRPLQKRGSVEVREALTDGVRGGTADNSRRRRNRWCT